MALRVYVVWRLSSGVARVLVLRPVPGSRLLLGGETMKIKQRKSKKKKKMKEARAGDAVQLFFCWNGWDASAEELRS